MAAKKAGRGVRKRAPKRSVGKVTRPSAARATVGRAAVEEARCAGLLDGEKKRFTLQAPKALVEEAMRESGARLGRRNSGYSRSWCSAIPSRNF
jgi:hypothetical protein